MSAFLSPEQRARLEEIAARAKKPADPAGSPAQAQEPHQADPAPNATPEPEEPSGGPVPLVNFTVLTSAGGPLTKHRHLLPGGVLSKPKAPNFVGGYAAVLSRPLHDLMDGLKKNQCLVGGTPANPFPLPPGEGVHVVVEDKLPQHPTAVARTKKYFAYRPGVPAPMVFDLDPNGDAFPPIPGATPREAHSRVVALFPGLKGAAALAVESASSGRYIRIADGAILREKYGSHVYFAAADGADVPRAGEVAFKRMVLAGCGSIALAKNSALLRRGVFDPSVFKGERVDFSAQATVGPGLRVEGRSDPVKIYGGVVDTRVVFPDLTAAEEKAYDAEDRRLKQAVPGDRVKKQREKFEDETVDRMTRKGKSREQAREDVKTTRPGYRGSLGAGFVLDFADLGEVTVAEVLGEPAKYHKASLADPIEGVEYGICAKLFVNDNGSIIINSNAHGGQVFTLRDKVEAEKAKADETPPWVKAATLERMIGNPLLVGASMLLDNKKVSAMHQKARKKWLRRVEVYVALGAIKAQNFVLPREKIVQIAAVGPGEIKPSAHALELGRRAIDLILARDIGLDAAEEAAKRASEKKEGPGGMGETEAEILAKAPDGWENDGDGSAMPGVSSNFQHFLSHHLSLNVELDAFKESVTFKRLSKVDAVSDEMLGRWNASFEAAVRDVYRLTTDVTRPWGPSGYSPRKLDVQDWLLSLADERSYNSATDTLMAWAPWDKVKRLHDWGARYFGYEPGDPEYDYVRHASAHMLRGFVGRILRPGVQFDEMLVLLGLQGERKTSLVRLLGTTIVADGYLEGAHLNFDESAGHNRIAIATTGKVIVEMAELKGLYKRDVEDQKRIITRTADTGRAMYGKTIYTKQRQWIMVGTANCVTVEDADKVLAELAGLALEKRRKRKRDIMAGADLGFLVDESGNRRYLPVAVMADVIDLDGLAKELPQLIAEAKAEVIARNFCLKMDLELEKLAGQHAGKFRATGDLGERIAAALAKFDGKDVNFTRQDMIKVLDIKTETDKTKMGAALRNAGFESYVGNHGLTRFYRGDKDKATRLTLTEFGTVRFKEETAAEDAKSGATKEPEGSFNPGGSPCVAPNGFG